MDPQLIWALTIYAFVSSATPGPNNVMLMASGANFGFRRTIPHMFGIGVGIVVMIVLIGLGLAQVFDRFPVAHDVLTIVSVLYLLWLTWKIATAAAPKGPDPDASPMTLFQAALFQWVNPKAWTMVITAVTLYLPDQSLGAVLVAAAVFGMVNFPSVSLWTVLGQQLRRLLTSPARLTAFNWVMAALLLASLWPVLKPYVT